MRFDTYSAPALLDRRLHVPDGADRRRDPAPRGRRAGGGRGRQPARRAAPAARRRDLAHRPDRESRRGDGLLRATWATCSRSTARSCGRACSRAWCRTSSTTTCARMGLLFGPDTSTSNRATLGGMIGNNSGGSHSIAYGLTVEHVIEIQTHPGRRQPRHLRDGDARRSSRPRCARPAWRAASTARSTRIRDPVRRGDPHALSAALAAGLRLQPRRAGEGPPAQHGPPDRGLGGHLPHGGGGQGAPGARSPRPPRSTSSTTTTCRRRSSPRRRSSRPGPTRSS